MESIQKGKYLVMALVAICVFIFSSSFALAEEIEGDLYAAQTNDIGWVKIWQENGMLYINIHTAKQYWSLTLTHVHVATSLGGIPQTGKGNPIPGHFDFKTPHPGGTNDYTYEIVDPGWTPGTPLYVAVHADVKYANPCSGICYSETAWGCYACGVNDCYSFPGKKWAYCIIYIVQ